MEINAKVQEVMAHQRRVCDVAQYEITSLLT